MRIIGLSVRVTLSAVALGCLIGVPFGAALVVLRFPGRGVLTTLINAFMGLPPVVVGLAVYLMLSRSGPLGVLELLYTPTAMIIAQTLLVTPLIAALSRQALADLAPNIRVVRSLRVAGWRRCKRCFGTGAMACHRGASRLRPCYRGSRRGDHRRRQHQHVTRVMTTTIALETSKGI